MHERIGVGEQRQFDVKERQLDRILEEEVFVRHRARGDREVEEDEEIRDPKAPPTAAASSTAPLIALRSLASAAIDGSSDGEAVVGAEGVAETSCAGGSGIVGARSGTSGWVMVSAPCSHLLATFERIEASGRGGVAWRACARTSSRRGTGPIRCDGRRSRSPGAANAPTMSLAAPSRSTKTNAALLAASSMEFDDILLTHLADQGEARRPAWQARPIDDVLVRIGVDHRDARAPIAMGSVPAFGCPVAIPVPIAAGRTGATRWPTGFPQSV